MISIRKSFDRGYADHGWLKSYHTFSFADYYDPRHMGFGNLRVINEDRIAAGTGFGTHGHRDMEIVSYVLDGALAHKDSIGNGAPDGANGGVIRPGDVQRMSAGTGVRHSEFNHAADRETHFLQIWIVPNVVGIPAGYEEKSFSADQKRGRLCLIASPDGAQGSVQIHQDVQVYAGLFDGPEQSQLRVAPGRLVYVHVARGRIAANGEALEAGDALKLTNEPDLRLSGGEGAEVLVFDLPGDVR